MISALSDLADTLAHTSAVMAKVADFSLTPPTLKANNFAAFDLKTLYYLYGKI